MHDEKYEYKIINSILRKKVKEQAAYIADLEERLGTPGIQEQQLRATILEISKKIKNKKKKGK